MGVLLVVDLDGSLIRSDMLAECFFAALGRNPVGAIGALSRLGEGRAALKSRLAAIARPEVERLPYNEAVLGRLEEARASGRRTALVSAADQSLVEAVASHLGLFDEAHGSDGRRNLKGQAKAEFLVERYGREGFDYLGDARADLDVWAEARHAMTVGAGPGFSAEVTSRHPEAEHLDPTPGGLAALAPYLKAMRPHQWLKNTLVLLPALAAHSEDLAAWAMALLAAIAFSLTASSVYLLNDLLDISADRAHPRKRFRPFAAGRASLMNGALLAVALLAAAFLLSLAFLPLQFLIVLAVYYVLTLAYSLGLKRMLVVDIASLAGLYSLRVIAGAAATSIALSPWMLAFCGFFFFALAAVKRQAELTDARASGRAEIAGRAYRIEDWPVVMAMAVAAGHASVLVLALYIASPKVQGLYGAPDLLWGICPILLAWLCRLSIVTHRGEMTDDPLVFAIRDRVSWAVGAACLALGLLGTVL
ncbi:MAG: UbiA family prenyltransferase [Pseudomonadota bacterium]